MFTLTKIWQLQYIDHIDDAKRGSIDRLDSSDVSLLGHNGSLADIVDDVIGGTAVVFDGEVDPDQGHDESEETQLEGEEDNAEPKVTWKKRWVTKADCYALFLIGLGLI